MSENTNNGSGFRPRSGRDLYMVPVADRLNDQFRLIDTLVLSMTDSWAYLPPRAKHILWLKLASCDRSFLESNGMPMENGILLHWSMWPDDLGDYAQAISLKSSRQQLEYLEPKNIAMASAMKQAEVAENTARLQIQLAQILLQLSSTGANATELAKLFSKNKFDRESIQTVLNNAQEAMHQQMVENERRRVMQQQENLPPGMPPPPPGGIPTTPGMIPTPPNLSPLAEQFEEISEEPNSTEGQCSECGKDCQYYIGEDELGKFMLDICAECYDSIVSQSEGEQLFDDSDIDSLIEKMDNGVMTDQQLLQLSEDMTEDGIFVDDEGDGEGVWVDTTDGPFFAEQVNDGEE